VLAQLSAVFLTKEAVERFFDGGQHHHSHHGGEAAIIQVIFLRFYFKKQRLDGVCLQNFF